MLTLVEVPNPFNRRQDKKSRVPYFTSISKVLKFVKGKDFKDFPFATICLVNGEPILRKDWKKPTLRQNDVITFKTVPQEVFTLIVLIVIAVASVVAAILLRPNVPRPTIPGQTPAANPVYSLGGQANKINLGNPVEVIYGNNYAFPSIAAPAYSQFIGNDEYTYILLCLGQGYFQIEQLYIGLTEIESFADITYQVYDPYKFKNDLFPNNVETSSDIAGTNIELFGPNETDYPLGGFSNAYVANEAYTRASRLEVDIILPTGLYALNPADGSLGLETAQATFQCQLIDDLGNPIGPWQTLATFNQQMANNTPQRFTIGADVSPGRYQVRGGRTNATGLATSEADTINWAGLRAFLPSFSNFGGKTMIAIKARATNNLNDNSANQIKCLCTRLLPIWNGSSWTYPTANVRVDLDASPSALATRNPVWAFCDIFMAQYGGQMSPSQLDLNTLLTMAGDCATRGDTFDWIFDQKTTVWDIAKAIALVIRAVPLLNPVSMSRDEPISIPTGVFTQNNIIKDSFKLLSNFATIDAYDGLIVTYIDHDSGNTQSVLCTLPDEQGLNPQTQQIPGVSSQAQAFYLGMYIRAVLRQVDSIQMQTGEEGFIPTYNDGISITHDLPSLWGQAGLTVAVGSGTNPIIQLDQPVTFDGVHTYQLQLRKKDGSVSGPYTVTAGADAYHVVVTGTITDTFFFDDQDEVPYWQFGIAGQQSKICKVTSIAPSQDAGDTENFAITADVYTPSRYSYDSLPVPPVGAPTYIPTLVPDLPVITGFAVSTLPNNFSLLLLSWKPALGAQTYIIQTSNDNVSWNTVANIINSSYVLSVTSGFLYIRVAALNVGQGPFVTWSGQVGIAISSPSNITGLALTGAFVGTSVSVTWDSEATAVSYLIHVYQNGGGTLMRTRVVLTPGFTYAIADAIIDGAILPPNRTLRIGVSAVNALGLTSPVEAVLDVANPQPAALTGMGSTMITDVPHSGGYDVFTLSYDASTDTDLANYMIWASSTSGFTPGAGNLIYYGPLTSFNFTIYKDVSGLYAAQYWRVAAYDVWSLTPPPSGTPDTMNISAEQLIAARTVDD